MPSKYITPQTQVLPLTIVFIKKDGIWETYARSYRPDYITSVLGSLHNTPTYRDRSLVKTSVLKYNQSKADIDEVLECLNAPTPHI